MVVEVVAVAIIIVVVGEVVAVVIIIFVAVERCQDLDTPLWDRVDGLGTPLPPPRGEQQSLQWRGVVRT